MGYVVPVCGPDAGRLVRREAAVSSSAVVPDEAALDAVIPGRAAIRELYAPSGDTAAARARGTSILTAEIRQDLIRNGQPDPGYDAVRDRIHLARDREQT